MGMIYLLLAAELLEKSYKSYLLGFLASEIIRLRLIRFLAAGVGAKQTKITVFIRMVVKIQRLCRGGNLLRST